MSRSRSIIYISSDSDSQSESSEFNSTGGICGSDNKRGRSSSERSGYNINKKLRVSENKILSGENREKNNKTHNDNSKKCGNHREPEVLVQVFTSTPNNSGLNSHNQIQPTLSTITSTDSSQLPQSPEPGK